MRRDPPAVILTAGFAVEGGARVVQSSDGTGARAASGSKSSDKRAVRVEVGHRYRCVHEHCPGGAGALHDHGGNFGPQHPGEERERGRARGWGRSDG
jgi:hypothetical protein